MQAIKTQAPAFAPAPQRDFVLGDLRQPSAYRIQPASTQPFDSQKIQRFTHNFQDHPLMQMPALAALAKRLMPTQQCRFIRPKTTQASEFLHDPAAHDGRDIDEVFARIEEPGSWIALYNVETEPDYCGFLDEVMTQAAPLVRQQQPGIFNVGGFIFISAPPSVTPFHIDRENNFWLQLRGRKAISLWDHRDANVVPRVHVEDFILNGNLGNVRLEPQALERRVEFETQPGDGVYFPSTSPHATRSSTDWVRPGDGVSVSIGVVFYSDTTRHHARVHNFNFVWRKLGFEPKPPGESAWLDGLKAPLGQALVGVRRRWRGYKPPPGIL